MMRFWSGLALGVAVSISAAAAEAPRELFFVKAQAKNQAERTRIANAGVAIDGVLSDAVTFLATPHDIAKVKALGVPVTVTALPKGARNFPNADKAYHTYQQTTDALNKIAKDHPDIAQIVSIGKSVEGRDLLAIRLSGETQHDVLPTAIFMGCHHAREHLSVEVPLMLAQYLADHYAGDARVHELLNTREVWVLPMVNPDGAEYDIGSSNYRMWRKNRTKNGDGSYGVDLNRNYGGPGFGGSQGASDDMTDETYHGPSAFSEPETQAIRDFVLARHKTTVLLTFHTFSELVLWPWGYTNDPIADTKDRAVFETMGKKMATWNHYTPEKSSDLYETTGDTTDWAYSERKIFAFTFEMTPTSMFDGGFYPGAQAIQPTFDANLQPALYLIENAVNPYDAVSKNNDPLEMLQ